MLKIFSVLITLLALSACGEEDPLRTEAHRRPCLQNHSHSGPTDICIFNTKKAEAFAKGQGAVPPQNAGGRPPLPPSGRPSPQPTSNQPPPPPAWYGKYQSK